MTTAHRATFTHAKAKDTSLSQTYQATLTHKRFLPAHTQLKYRSKKLDPQNNDSGDLSDADKVHEMKKKLMRKEHAHFTSVGHKLADKSTEDQSQEQPRLAITTGSRELDNDSSDDEEMMSQGNNGVMGILNTASDSENSDDDDDDEDSEDDDEDEDETAQLLLELENIKNERKQREQQKQELEVTEVAKTSNPLVQFADNNDNENENQGGLKRSWRDSTLFSNKKRKGTNEVKNGDDGFSNDLLHSQFHRKFLERYIR
ncbi:hypothetical protein DASC09_001670 [Saccharomycopsis crataegensis]|uniref:Pre-mRNA-splicing factor CWC15 n=1 Tax=Saccharomycopsis crataegensis TaxID=43959 RepID=A0AAV5QDT3_9ASCO|nr:hypothetical protein DASC09_001670 [Saccharomycopsis crataegensis]